MPQQPPIRIARLAATLALTILAAARSHAECRLGHVADLPVTIQSNHLLVGGQINDRPATLIFDTGSATTFLTEAAARRLDLRAVRGEEHNLGGFATVEGVAGNSSARAVEARSIDLGGLRARNFAFFAVNMAFAGFRPPPDGLLSADLLAKYDIDLNLGAKRIGLYYPISDCAQPAAYMPGPLYTVPLLPGSRDRSPQIPVSIGGRNFTAVIDTGSPGSVLFAPTARALGLALAPGAGAEPVSGLAGRRILAATATLPTLGIGDLDFNNVHVEIDPEALGTPENPVDLLIGLDFLSRVHAWVSFSSNTLILQYPPK